MIDFLLLTYRSGDKCLVPLDKIQYIEDDNGVAIVYLTNTTTSLVVKETVTQIVETLQKLEY